MKVKVIDGKKIAEARIRQGLGMRQFARIAKVNYSVVSYLERGKREFVAPQTAKAICETLQIPFDDLFEIVEIGGDAA